MECRKCKAPLIADVNWYGRGNTRGNICHPCFRIYINWWARETEKGRVTVKRKTAYARQNYIGVRSGNKRYYVKAENKRDYTGQCEMCDRSDRRLVYHHWDDSDYSLGIWICQGCHNAAHVVEAGLDLTYRELKDRISRKVA